MTEKYYDCPKCGGEIGNPHESGLYICPDCRRIWDESALEEVEEDDETEEEMFKWATRGQRG